MRRTGPAEALLLNDDSCPRFRGLQDQTTGYSADKANCEVMDQEKSCAAGFSIDSWGVRLCQKCGSRKTVQWTADPLICQHASDPDPDLIDTGVLTVNPLRELDELLELFPELPENQLFQRAEHIAKETTPEPYHSMLVHDHHMTISMESWHQCSVDVRVLDSRVVDGLYCRRIQLLKSGSEEVVQFGYVRFNLDLVTERVRHEIQAEQIPLGRILIQHNVFRHVDLGAILRFTAGPGLHRFLPMQSGEVTFGRLATIFCNGAPAIDLLEVSAPLSPRRV